MRRVTVGVVGLGYWGPNLVRVLNELPDADLVRVCDLDTTALARLGKRHPDINCTTEYSEILDDDAVDAVAIATPVATHYSLAKAALDRGKHVFVEKPLAASVREGDDLVTLAAKRNLTLMPGHTFLYSPAVQEVRRLIESGELGDIYFVSMSRVNLGLHQSDVSVVWDLAPHDFSILTYWLDELPSKIAAISRSCIIAGRPDVAFINLEYGSGTIAHVEIAWLAPTKLRRTTVTGSRKMVVYDDTSNEPIRIFDSGVDVPNPHSFGEYRLTYRTGDVLSPRMEAVEPIENEMRDFCSAIRERRQPESSAAHGLAVVRMAEAVDRSLAIQGAPVDVRGIREASPRQERLELT